MLLDSNVLSELNRKARYPSVAIWMASVPLEDLFFSAVGEAEQCNHAAALPVGRRRETLLPDIEGMLRGAFGDRVLLFHRAGAREYADIAAA